MCMINMEWLLHVDWLSGGTGGKQTRADKNNNESVSAR